MASASAPDGLGRLLAGKYRLEAQLAVGGMGAVYRAMNEIVSRPVAIKILRPEFGNNEQFVKRFMREGRAANIIKHPNIVDVIDIDRDEGDLFIVQDLLKGEDLGTRLKRTKQLPIKATLAVAVPVAEALGAAHEHGIVHRDLKPANVFLAEVEGKIVPKVLDFGVAKMLDPEGDTRLTPTFAALGTPAYMSPEQITEPLTVDARSDVWAMGIMLHRMVTGKLPFESESQGGMLVAICTKSPTLLIAETTDAPPSFEQLVRKCLTRDPKERYANCAEVALALREVHAEARKGVKGPQKRRLSGAATLIGGSLPADADAPASSPLPDLELLAPRSAAPPVSTPSPDLAELGPPEPGWSDLQKSAPPGSSGPPMASRPPSGAPRRSGRPPSNNLLAELMSDEPDPVAHAPTHVSEGDSFDLPDSDPLVPRSGVPRSSVRPIRTPMSRAPSMRPRPAPAPPPGPLTAGELTHMGLAGLVVGVVVSAGSSLQQADALERLDGRMGWAGVAAVTALIGFAAYKSYEHATNNGWLSLLAAAVGLAALTLCGLGTALAVADGFEYFDLIQKGGPWIAAGTAGSFAVFGVARGMEAFDRKNFAFSVIGLSVIAGALALKLVVG
jgi:serine/threonine-protein kinase